MTAEDIYIFIYLHMYWMKVKNLINYFFLRRQERTHTMLIYVCNKYNLFVRCFICDLGSLSLLESVFQKLKLVNDKFHCDKHMLLTT